MKLPNADKAIIDSKKIKDYCLNPDHPRGKHKAKIFQSSLDLTFENTEELIYEITKNLPEFECRQGEVDEYGQRYTVDIEIERNGLRAVIRTGWIIKRNEMQPRLTTCFVK
ncbi:MAG: hypothetical protein K9J83_03005 [Desulfarculaceae bacterium]|nr:hypothetical protein [Desulfarculaceae bacterium]